MLRPRTGSVWAQSANGTVVAELLRSAIDADVSPFLSKIKARTLVINRLDDIFVRSPSLRVWRRKYVMRGWLPRPDEAPRYRGL